jgi:hypothetical protein
MSLTKGILLCLVALSVTSCADPNMRVSQVQFGTSQTLVSGPNLRLVTERSRQVGSDIFPAQCTEPSPDVAIAFAQSAALSASYASQANVNASGSASYGSSETALALSGRTAGVLALRDGLYAACQAYANGVIGHDAYAVILSQYGKLLVALVGNSGGAGAPAAQVSAGATAANTATPPAAPPTSKKATSENMLKPGEPLGVQVADISGRVYAQAPTTNSPTSAQGPTSSTTAPKPSTPTKQSNSPASPPKPTVKSSTAAPAWVDDAVGALLVSCISEYDPSRLIPVVGGVPQTNRLLTPKNCSAIVENAIKASGK